MGRSRAIMDVDPARGIALAEDIMMKGITARGHYCP